MSTRIAIALTFAGFVALFGLTITGVAVTKGTEIATVALTRATPFSDGVVGGVVVTLGLAAVGGLVLAGTMASMIVDQIRKGAR